jgi:hypothetical protein
METFPTASSEYVSLTTTNPDSLPDGVSCFQTFSYAAQTTHNNFVSNIWKFITGSIGDPHNPDELHLDDDTGVF